MRIGSLFSGIGGLELGLERAGLGHTVWQAEIDPFCQKVLAHRWPDVPIYNSVQEVDSSTPAVDLICGGYPCQDLSSANPTGQGLKGPKSSLWYEYLRVVETLNPKVVVIENVYSSWREWVPEVRRDLWRAGYTSVPVRVCAGDVGAPHIRARCFVVAYPHEYSKSACAFHAEAQKLRSPASPRWFDWGSPPPEALGVDDGLSQGMDAVSAYGNAVVPQVATVVGIMIRNSLGLDPVDTGHTPKYLHEL